MNHATGLTALVSRRPLIALLFAGSMLVALAATAAEPAYRVYVTNEGSGDLTVIDGLTRAVVATLPLGKRPRGIAAAADGRHLYVAVSGSPPAGPGGDESCAPRPLGRRPGGIAAAADGRHLSVAVSGSPLAGRGVDESSLPPADKTAD